MGGTIASEFYDDLVFSTFSGNTPKRSLDVPIDIYGTSVTFENPQIGPLPEGANIQFDFGGTLTVVPSPGAVALFGLVGIAATRRRR